VAVGVVTGTALDTFRTLVTQLYHPVLRSQSDWGKLSGPEHAKNTEAFLMDVGRFGAVLTEAVTSLAARVELPKPDARWISTVGLKPQEFSRAAADSECSDHMDAILELWVAVTGAVLGECQSGESSADDSYHTGSAGKSFGRQSSSGDGSGASAVALAKTDSLVKQESDDAGPDTELGYWRLRMSRLNSIIEQLKSKACRLVLGVTLAARSKSNRAWRQIDTRLSDAVNEAADNVKYLATLEVSLAPMYVGTPAQVIDGLPVGFRIKTV